MIHIPFDNSYARLPQPFFVSQHPSPVSAPVLLAWNTELAADLGISWDQNQDPRPHVFGGNVLPAGAEPIAQAYSGHQFGHFNPGLGDGRAILLGEVIDQSGRRRDIQLKGSGQTPFSRRGDGRAWLGPVLREYLVSEAMHAFDIPTTRALAAVATGDTVYRETALPGAVITRVASSHIRVGTFEYFAARNDRENLQILFEYARDRHFSDAETPLDFLTAVVQKQSALIAQWMGVGFIHGVMNTDNCHIDGITIDYGPCAFMDHYHPQTVFSSIDQFGRYAYDAQRHVIVWNMAQLASALLSLLPNQAQAIEDMTKIVHSMPELLTQKINSVFAQKLGIVDFQPEDADLIEEFLNILTEGRIDFTNAFWHLGQGTEFEVLPNTARAKDWHTAWKSRQSMSSRDLMHKVNPFMIPRNHQIEHMIDLAKTGDLSKFHNMVTALKTPYVENDAFRDLTVPPSPQQEVKATFCGT